MSQKGDDSSNLQAGRDVVVYNGMSPAEVSTLLREALEANALQMRAIARDEMQSRLRAFTDRFVDKTQSAPEVVEATADPDVQAAFIEAGIGFARSGDADLGEILIDLVADRARQETRSLLAVVLNDAVAIAPRLTDGEVAILTIAWRLLRTIDNSVVDLNKLADFVAEIAQLIPYVPRGDASYLHLQSLGCVGIDITSREFSQVWLNTYRGLFMNGFSWDDVPGEGDVRAGLSDWLMPCLRDQSKLQVNAINEAALRQRIAESQAAPDVDRLVSLMNTYSMSEQEVLDSLAAIDVRTRTLSDIWASTPIKSLSVTAVGMAIGHANWRHMTGKTAPLEIWINEGDVRLP